MLYALYYIEYVQIPELVENDVTSSLRIDADLQKTDTSNARIDTLYNIFNTEFLPDQKYTAQTLDSLGHDMQIIRKQLPY